MFLLLTLNPITKPLMTLTEKLPTNVALHLQREFAFHMHLFPFQEGKNDIDTGCCEKEGGESERNIHLMGLRKGLCPSTGTCLCILMIKLCSERQIKFFPLSVCPVCWAFKGARCFLFIHFYALFFSPQNQSWCDTVRIQLQFEETAGTREKVVIVDGWSESPVWKSHSGWHKTDQTSLTLYLNCTPFCQHSELVCVYI